ncbi:MAG: CapA family protein, partial [Clostridia bacterium]|nr:CapA family protein [Clostridia bacterium]
GESSSVESVGNSSAADTSSLHQSSVGEESSVAGTSSEEEPSLPEESEDESSAPDIIDLPEDPVDTVVSFVACGDNLIHPSVYYGAMEYYAAANGTKVNYKDWPTNEMDYDFLPIYEYVADTMKNADICYINQETLSGGPGTKIDGYPQFNTPIAMGRDLAALGVDIVNMAHNHMLDSGNDKLLKYSDPYFKSLGMTPLGYYKDEADTNNIVLYEKEGITFALLTYTYGTNEITCRTETYIPYFDEELIRRQVGLAHALADVVIVSAHWGYEDSYTQNQMQRNYAELFCELEVDVVIGTHSHCLQPMKWVENDITGHKMLLTYSLGNFVSGMQNALNVLEGMLSFDVRKSAETGEISIENPILTPVVLHYTKESADGEKDTGYRNFKIYELKDYTEELVKEHGVTWYEKKKGTTTLKGGKFSIENLYKTLQSVIPAEFLPEEYR